MELVHRNETNACVIHCFDEILLPVIMVAATSERETDTTTNNSRACSDQLLFDAE